MFEVNNDLSIHITRGDIGLLSVTADSGNAAYVFAKGDIVRFKVYEKKGCDCVVLMKDFTVEEETEKVDILLTGDDTRIGELIHKPKDYWYEVELNPDTNPQTIIGYDDNGAKVFRLYPEGREIEYEPGDDAPYLEQLVEKEVAEYLTKNPPKDGEKGENGADGYTPVRGVDYWTEEDKSKIVSETKEAVVFDAAQYGVPVIYFDGDISLMDKDNAVTLNYRYGDRQGTCTLKWQGSSSLAYPKKNYTVKFDTAFEAKEGWGEEKKYCLKADWIDFSHCRNIVSAKVWGEIVKSRLPSDIVTKLSTLPNGGAVDGFPCFVVINGEWKGIYNFTIPKDGWMMGMGSGNREAILCADGNNDACAFRVEATVGEDGSDFELEYHSDNFAQSEIQDSFNRLIRACRDSDGTDIETTIAQYLDINSAIDYYIYVVLLNHTDGIQKNAIFATYDGVKWFMSAYDLDSTWGLYWDGKKFEKSSYEELWYHSFGFAKLAQRHKVFELLYKYKKEAIIARYNELRRLVMSVGNTSMLFNNYGTGIPFAAKEAENRLWKELPSTNTNNVNQINEWYADRVKWTDEEVEQISEMVDDSYNNTKGLAYTRMSDQFSQCDGIGNATETDIVIAKYYDGLPVTKIVNNAFKNNSNITSVVIPDGVKTIGNEAFRIAANLASVEMPESVETIGNTAFAQTAITNIVFPKKLKKISNYNCWKCNELEMVKMGNRVTEIGESAFNECMKLPSINLSKSLTTLGNEAFLHCGALDNLKLPEGLKSIGYRTFAWTDKWNDVTIPASVETIGAEAFGWGKYRTKVTFKGKPNSIGDNAFIDMKAGADIYVPWAEGEVAGAPWGATKATIHYNSET